MANPYTELLSAARAHALEHGARIPALSPLDDSLPHIDIPALHALGIRIVPWTANDPAAMRDLIAMGVDGLVSDRPDLLQQTLAKSPGLRKGFSVCGHRGARGLRPENTLASFEAALDTLVDAIETDVGITGDLHPVLSHEQYFNPETTRRADREPYEFADAIYLRDITLFDAHRLFRCDKLLPGFPDQSNDPALSPVTLAFAAKRHLRHAYSPITIAQLFSFAAFYAQYYRSFAGQNHPEASRRAANADRVSFNLEAKILPLPDGGAKKPRKNTSPATNHTVDVQTFVSTLCNAITGAHMEERCNVLSFDFRVLQLVEEQFPEIATYYLTEEPESLASELIPASLRQGKTTMD